MKKYLALIVIILAVPMLLWSADLRILYTERMVGAGSPSYSDTLNRLTLAHHNTDGSHIDNDISGTKITDLTITNGKIANATISLGKLSATGTPSASTYLRGDNTWVNPQVALASYRNLKITTPADNQSVTITADKVVVTDSSDNYRVLSTVSLTVLLTSTGANKLDTGSLAASTGYFLYVIDNGATTAGLASLSATAPSMPAGYTFKALVGWCATDATGTPFNISEFTQIDDEYIWFSPKKILNGFTGSANTQTISLSASGYLGYPVAPAGITKILKGRSSLDTGLGWFYNPLTFTNSLGEGNTVTYGEGHEQSSAGVKGGHNFEVPIITDQTFYAQSVSGSGVLELWAVGFTLKR